jgi:hypothetical protein
MMDLAQYEKKGFSPGDIGVWRQLGQPQRALLANNEDVNQRAQHRAGNIGRRKAHRQVGVFDAVKDRRLLQEDKLQECVPRWEGPPGQCQVSGTGG